MGGILGRSLTEEHEPEDAPQDRAHLESVAGCMYFCAYSYNAML